MTVTCTEFNDLVLDLAYGELDEASAERLRTHAAGCPGCREILDGLLLTRKLVAKPTVVEPEPSMDTAILDAAREAVSSGDLKPRGHIDIAPREALLDAGGWLEKMRGLLLKPAFATAAVAATVLLVTTILVRVSPRSPSSAVQGDLDAISRHAEVSDVSGSGEEMSDDRRAPASALPAIKAADEGGEGEEALAAEVRSDARFRLGTRGGTGNGEPGSSFRSAKRSASPARSAPSSPPPEPQGRIDGDAEARQGAGAGIPAATLDEKAIVAPLADDIGQRAGSVDADFSRGMEAYRRGDCGTAREFLGRVTRVGGTDRATAAVALHHVARCEKRQGQCGRAISTYDRLFSSFPEYPQRADALYEAAQCRRRLGHVEAARSLLEELSHTPGQEERARDAIERLSSPPSEGRE